MICFQVASNRSAEHHSVLPLPQLLVLIDGGAGWEPSSSLARGVYCLQLLSDSWLGVRTSPRAVVPSKRCEAMAAWWDMLFRTMSPFRHNTTSCKIGRVQHDTERKAQGWASQRPTFLLCLSLSKDSSCPHSPSQGSCGCFGLRRADCSLAVGPGKQTGNPHSCSGTQGNP